MDKTEKEDIEKKIQDKHQRFLNYLSSITPEMIKPVIDDLMQKLQKNLKK